MNNGNLISEWIKLDKRSDVFEIWKCWISTLNHVEEEYLKEKTHQIFEKELNTAEDNPRNDSISSINNTDDNTSTSEKIGTSVTQTPICIKTQEMQCINNVLSSVANTSRQDTTLLQQTVKKNSAKKSTPGIFTSGDIFTEVNNLLTNAKYLSKTKSRYKQYRIASERYNKMYRLEYLSFEDIMFSCNHWKLMQIKNNLWYYIPSIDGSVFCLLCRVKHSCDLQVWYEHVSCTEHKNKPLSPNSIFLLEQRIGKEFPIVVCYACNNTRMNETLVDTHINEVTHQINHKMLLTQIESHYHKILTQTVNPFRYAIQYFACNQCKKRFKAKIEFMDHLYAQHTSVILQKKSNRFSFCLTCAILWYQGNNDFDSYHCNNLVHRYLEKSNDFAIKPFPQKVTKLLKCVDENVTALLKLSQDATAKYNTRLIIKDLKSTLKSYCPLTTEVRLYGSKITGLALPNSDIDIYVDFGDECTEDKIIERRCELIEECLRADHKIWKIEEILKNTRTPIIRLIHISTGMSCDISYTHGLSVENSKFIKSFNEAYLPCKKLILFLKKWMQLCNFDGSQKITNYSLVWLVIFYLQVRHGIPSVASLMKRHVKFVSGWRIFASYAIAIDGPELPISELLLGFFRYYAEFDYMHSVICPLLGNECNKELFTYSPKKESTFPEEMQPYLQQLQDVNPEYFRVDSAMCVQDPFVLSFNITRAVQVLTLRSFKEYCKKSASILSEITCY